MSASPKPAQPLYRLHPRQQDAMQLLGLTANWRAAQRPAEELLFGGSAGGGKSHLLRCIGVTLCMIWPGARVPLFRRTYPELLDSHIPWAQREVPTNMAEYHVGQHELRFANGSVLLFRHAEDDKSVFSYLTSEWAGLLIDQAEAFTEHQIRFLRSRVRQPIGAFGGGWRRVIVYTANPGGLSHQYLKDGWVDPAQAVPPGTIWPAILEDGGLRRAFLPARLADNPSLDPAQYRQVLQGLPAHLVSAYLEGSWDAVVGAYFDMWHATSLDGTPWHVWPESFARERYGVPDDESFPPKSWLRWAAVDFGVRDPWVTLFFTRAPDKRVFLYRELCGINLEVPAQARLLRQTLQQHNERLAVLIGDPAGFALRANLSVSDADVYKRYGLIVTRGTNKRQQGWRRLSELLSSTLDDSYPQLVVLEGTCPHLVRTLPALQADRMDHEDISDEHGRADPKNPRSLRDDWCDAARYGIMPFAAPEQDLQPREVESRMGDDLLVGPDAAPGWNQTGYVSAW